MSFVSIQQAILNKLNTLKTQGHLGEVYGYKTDSQEMEIGAWPVAILIELGNEGELLTTSSNQRAYKFEIHLLQEFEGDQDIASAWLTIRTKTDLILDTFDQDFTLGGAANGGVPPAVSSFDSFDRRNKKVARAMITLIYIKLINL